MKTTTLFLLGFLIFSVTTVTAQKISESKVPQDVVISFKYKYADAEIINWEMVDNTYIAKFKLNDQEGKAEFNEKGVWNVTKYFVEEKELPSTILNYYKTNFKNKEYSISLSELQKINTGKTIYYLEIRKEGYNQLEPIKLAFDMSGKLISKTDPELDKPKDADKPKDKDNKEAKEVKQSKETKEKTDKKENKKIEQVEPIIAADENQQYIVDPAKVPVEAKNHFTSKVKKATGSVWYLKDKIYTVRFTQAGQKGQSTYAKNGTWIETRVDQSPETLHQLILAYLKDHYRNFIIKSAELVSVEKDNSIFIRMYDKRSKETPPPITEIWFSPVGKLISVNKADVADDGDNYFDKRQEEKENEFLSEVDKGAVTYENADNYNDKINYKELPSPIHQYIGKYYKEYYVKESKLFSDDELGNIYLVTVKLEDSRYAVHLYFDLQGQYLKKIDEAEGKIVKDNNKPTAEKKVTEKTESKFGTTEEVVNPKELPVNVSKYLKKNYPQHTIAESYLKTDDDNGNFYLLILKKSGEKKLQKLTFDLDGNMLKNETDNR
jgi:hypothetical protein